MTKGVIETIGSNLQTSDKTKIIDASDYYVLPGGIDPHVHMQLPVGHSVSADNFITGTRAAIAGGTTTIIDFVTPERNESLLKSLSKRKKLAEHSWCDYGLHMSVTSWTPQIEREISHCLKEGIPSFKIYMAYKDSIGLDDFDILSAMNCIAKSKGLVLCHCEHGESIEYLQTKFISDAKTDVQYHPLSRPPAVEEEAVCRAILFSNLTTCPLYIVHVSTKEALLHIAAAKRKKNHIFAETCPHYLLLDQGNYFLSGNRGMAYVMSPPLRSRDHLAALWNSFENKIIDTIATDHCPFNRNVQQNGGAVDFTKIPNGVAGVEHRLALLYTFGVLKKRITINKLVDLCCTRPAQIFGLYPRKGAILEKADADLVLWDPNAQTFISAKTHQHHCDTSIFEGFKITGKPDMVILNGEIIFQEDSFIGSTGRGQFLYREPNNFQ